MGQVLLVLAVGLVVGAVVFGVSVLLTGGDPGLAPAEPDGRAAPLPTSRPLAEEDVAAVRFDVAARGYRMAQVDRALQRAAYDIGYKDELINVLEAEVTALRDGRTEDADVLRRAREAALSGTEPPRQLGLAPGSSPDPIVELGLVSAVPAAITPDHANPAVEIAGVAVPEPGGAKLSEPEIDEPEPEEPDLGELDLAELDEPERDEPERDEPERDEPEVHEPDQPEPGLGEPRAAGTGEARATEHDEALAAERDEGSDDAAEPVDPAADDALSSRR